MNTNNQNTMDCKAFGSELPDLVLNANTTPSPAAVAHLRTCPPCAEEYLSFQSTFAALDSWRAPEVSPYFDQKLAVRIREESASPKMSWFERLRTRLLLNTGRNFRPVLAGALALMLVAGGGGLAGINYSNVPAQPSAAVNDLQILDRNEQAFQQLDELQQDDPGTPADIDLQNSTPAPEAQPAS